MSRSAGYDTSDPRSIVTPEAFQISPDLLGRPLAPPRRRLAAILIDGVLIVLLSQAGGLLLGAAVVVLFFRMAVGRPERKRSAALARTFRAAVGCFGGVVLLVTGCGLWFVFGPGRGPDIDREIRQGLESRIQTSANLEDVFGGLSEVQAYRRAETADEAVAAGTRVARRLDRIGAPRDEIADALEELAPPDAPWEEQVGGIARRAMARIDEEAEGAPPEAPSAPGDTAVTPTGGPEVAEADTPQVGRDTLTALEERLAEEVREREEVEQRLERTRQELQEAREAGILRWVRRLSDDLGLAFGWGTVYMTLILSWWNGQTPGKKLLGIRVVQLDDSPISWWEAFERGGGYAAGFATGLLGFAQVYWDPNRQAIHDKISETVVLLEGEEPIPGPWRIRHPGSRP